MPVYAGGESKGDKSGKGPVGTITLLLLPSSWGTEKKCQPPGRGDPPPPPPHCCTRSPALEGKSLGMSGVRVGGPNPGGQHREEASVLVLMGHWAWRRLEAEPLEREKKSSRASTPESPPSLVREAVKDTPLGRAGKVGDLNPPPNPVCAKAEKGDPGGPTVATVGTVRDTAPCEPRGVMRAVARVPATPANTPGPHTVVALEGEFEDSKGAYHVALGRRSLAFAYRKGDPAMGTPLTQTWSLQRAPPQKGLTEKRALPAPR